MPDPHATPPDASTPVQVAKRCLREERAAQIDGEIAAIASMLNGAPMAFVPRVPEKQLDVNIGPLRLLCTARVLTEDEVAVTTPRYVMRHGSPHQEGTFIVLTPQSASVQMGGATHEIDAADLLTAGEGDLMAYERRAVDHMNDDHLDAVKSYAEVLLGAEVGEWRLASLDMDGLDLVRCDRGGTSHRRLWFHPPLAEPDEIKAKLVSLAIAGRAS